MFGAAFTTWCNSMRDIADPRELWTSLRRQSRASDEAITLDKGDDAQKRRADQLQAEYLHLQKVVEDFDGKALTIKAWSATLTSAGIAAAYSQGTPQLLLVTAGGACVFWIVELLWKMSQDAYYPRIEAIETCFREQRFDLAPMQISRWWPAPPSAHVARFLRALILPRVFLPHLLVAISAISLYLIAAPLPKHPSPTISAFYSGRPGPDTKLAVATRKIVVAIADPSDVGHSEWKAPSDR